MRERATLAIHDSASGAGDQRWVQAASGRSATRQFVCGRINEEPHPNSYFARDYKTLLDYVRWNLDNGNRAKAAAIIQQYLK